MRPLLTRPSVPHHSLSAFAHVCMCVSMCVRCPWGRRCQGPGIDRQAERMGYAVVLTGRSPAAAPGGWDQDGEASPGHWVPDSKARCKQPSGSASPESDALSAQSLPARIAAAPAAAPGVTHSPARPSRPLVQPQLLHPERQLWCRGPGSADGWEPAAISFPGDLGQLPQPHCFPASSLAKKEDAGPSFTVRG